MPPTRNHVPAAVEGDEAKFPTSDPKLWTYEDESIYAPLNTGLQEAGYSQGKLLGSGGFSNVSRVQRVRDKRVFAAKFLKSGEKTKDVNRHISRLVAEGKFLAQNKHKHIVKFIELCVDRESWSRTMLVLELCPEDTLQLKIDNSPEGLDRDEALLVVYQVAQALEFINEQGYLHGDVKPRNGMIRTWNPVDVVLGDWTPEPIVKTGSRGAETGTRAFWAPEIAGRRRDRVMCEDVWSLGITLLGMMGHWPKVFYTKHQMEWYNETCLEHVNRLRDLNPAHDVVALVATLMVWDQYQRPTAGQCRQHVETLLTIDNSWRKVRDVGVNRMGIKSPEDFEALQFW